MFSPASEKSLSKHCLPNGKILHFVELIDNLFLTHQLSVFSKSFLKQSFNLVVGKEASIAVSSAKKLNSDFETVLFMSLM